MNFRSEDLNCCQNYFSYFSLIDDNIKHFDKEIPVHRQEKRNKLMINGNTLNMEVLTYADSNFFMTQKNLMYRISKQKLWSDINF